jgi:hypothetical protein
MAWWKKLVIVAVVIAIFLAYVLLVHHPHSCSGPSC